jgi:hypothetical protein
MDELRPVNVLALPDSGYSTQANLEDSSEGYDGNVGSIGFGLLIW